MRSRILRPWPGVLAVVGLLLVSACAPKALPPPVAPTTPQFPNFIYPAVGSEVDAAIRTRQEVAWQYLQAGDVRVAEREFNAILRTQPDFAPSEAALGWTALARRQPAEALTRFDRAVQHQAGYASALVGRAQALLALGRNQEAVEAFEAAAAADPTLDLSASIAVLRLRGAQDAVTTARQAAERGDLEKAQAAYTQAIAESPDSGFLYRELAIVEGRAGKAAESIAHFRKAISLDPGDVRSQVLLGDALLAAGDSAGAIAAYTAARRLDASPEILAKLDAAAERAARERLPEQYRQLPSAAEVTRADVAAALGIEAPALVAAVPPRQGALMTDVRSHWAATWILQVVRAGLMEPMPNHTFQPDERVRRGDFAAIAARALDALAQSRPAATPATTDTTISDVPQGSPAYPAIARVVGAGVLPLDNGAFEPSRPLTGAELIAAAARLSALAAPETSSSRPANP